MPGQIEHPIKVVLKKRLHIQTSTCHPLILALDRLQNTQEHKGLCVLFVSWVSYFGSLENTIENHCLLTSLSVRLITKI